MSFLGWGRHDNAVAPLTFTTMQLPGTPQQSAADRTHYFPTLARDIQPVLNDPAAAAAIRTLEQFGEGSREGQAAMHTLQQRQHDLGVNLPPHMNWAVTPEGRIGFQHTDVNNDYVYPIATIVAAAGLGMGVASAAGAFSGGAAGAGGGGGAAAGGGGAAAAGGGGAAAGGGTAAAAAGHGIVPSLLSAGGSAAGAAADARNSRRNQNNATEIAAYNDRLAGLSYDQRRREILARQALLGSYLQNVSDTHIAPPAGVPMGNVTGGLRPSLLSNRATIGADLDNKATAALLRSEPAGPAPELNIQRPNGWDTALEVASLAGGAYDAYRSYRGTPAPRGGSSPGVTNPNVVASSGVTFAPGASASAPTTPAASYPSYIQPPSSNFLANNGVSFADDPYVRPRDYRDRVSLLR